MDWIIQTALDMGAQAIHPGYGFLAENPAFADKIQQAGLVFIGPDAQTMALMEIKLKLEKRWFRMVFPLFQEALGLSQVMRKQS